MTTKLRLLLDECVQAPLAVQIQACPGILSTEHVNAGHVLGNSSTTDEAIMEYATKENRVVVTVEGRFDESRFPICTHPGIIVLKAPGRHEAEKAAMFRRFMQSGHRAKCRHAITALTLDRFERRERIEGRLNTVSGKL